MMYLQEEVNDYLGGPVELDKEIQGESHVELYHLERIDGTTPLPYYWFIIAPYLNLTKPPFGSCTINFHYGVHKNLSKDKRDDNR